ncbi:MAG: hypothetical protein AAF492_21125, partial [Verrucomicrobiota bacterium]
CLAEDDWRLDVDPIFHRDDGLWYAVSRNLLYRSQEDDRTRLNWTLLDETPPYPWLTVRDAQGNVVSDEVAVVVIHPGRAVEGQNRLWTGGSPPDSDEYLESVTVGSVTYDNSDADGCPDTTPSCGGGGGEDFIIHGRTDEFNDRVAYITASELMHAVEKRVIGDVAVALENYRDTYGGFPWLSSYVDPDAVESAGFPLSGWAGVDGVGTESAGNRLIDTSANFTATGAAGVNVGDVVEIISDGSTGVVASIDSANQLTLSGLTGGTDNAVAVGDGYNIRPRYNGVLGIREGQLPFLDPDYDIDTAGAQAETVAFNTGFSVDWERRANESDAEGQLSFPNGGSFAALVDAADDGLPAGALYDSVERDEVVENVKDAVWGLLEDVTVGDLISGDGNGVCRWTGSEGQVRCRGTSARIAASYQLTVTDTRSTPYEIHTFDVYRIYTFDLTVDGDARTENSGNAKRRAVSYSPSGGGSGDAFTIQVDEFVASEDQFGSDYRLHTMEYTE